MKMSITAKKEFQESEKGLYQGNKSYFFVQKENLSCQACFALEK